MGREQSPETRAKLSAARTGRPLSPEHRAALMGREFSDETRAKISAALTGRKHGPLSPEHRAKLSAVRAGRPKSLEWRARMSAMATGRKPSPQTCTAVTAANKARVPSLQQREKSRLAMLGNRNQQEAPIKGECAYCLGPAQAWDHVVPRGRPGWDRPDNVVPACYSCNGWKGARTPEEWWTAIGA